MCRVVVVGRGRQIIMIDRCTWACERGAHASVVLKVRSWHDGRASELGSCVCCFAASRQALSLARSKKPRPTLAVRFLLGRWCACGGDCNIEDL